MSQEFFNKPQQEQSLNVGNITVEGTENYIDFSQKQITYISIEEIKTRQFIQTSPYKGLKRFESNAWDVKRFFGRTQFINDLLTDLEETHLILLLGASGSGKSSVIRAGLIPWLSKKWGANFVNLTFTPDKDPFESLYISLASHFRQEDAKIARRAKANTLVQILKNLKQPNSNWFIFVDQFEELFTTSQAEKRDQFIYALGKLVKELGRTQNFSIKVVAAMRADFLDQLSPYRELIRITNKHRPIIAEMQPDELRLAIEQPAAQQGVVFEKGLVETIIKDVWKQAGYLPLLQYTLNLIWETEVKNGSIQDRTLNTNTYLSLGGVRGALQNHVDEIYKALSASERLIMQRIFLKLVSIGSDEESETAWKPVRRRASQLEFNGPLEKKLLRQLIDRNLLVSNHSNDFQQATVEIAHEVLLSSWVKLNDWIKENRQAIALRNRLNDDVTRWQGKRNDDELWTGSKLEQVLELRENVNFNQVLGGFSKASNDFINASIRLRDSKQRRAILGLAGFSTTALLLASITTWQWKKAAYQEKIALEQQKIALVRQLSAQADQLINQSPNTLDTSILIAIEAVERASREENIEIPLLAMQALDQGISLLPKPTHFFAHDKKVWKLKVLSPNEEYLATISGQSYLGDEVEGNSAQVWHIATGEEVLNLKFEQPITDLIFSPDNRFLLTADSSGRIKFWDYINQQEKKQIEYDAPIYKISFNSSGDILFIMTGGDLVLWDIDTHKELNKFSDEGEIEDFSLVNDGKVIVFRKLYIDRERGPFQQISVRDFENNQELWKRKISHRAFDLAVSSDGKYISTLNDRSSPVWGVSNSQEAIDVNNGNATVGGVIFSPDSNFFATVYDDRTVGIWNIPENQEVSRIAMGRWGGFGLTGANVLEFSPSSNLLTANMAEPILRVWTVNDGKEVIRIPQDSSVTSTIFDKTGQRLITATNNGEVRIWDLNGSVGRRYLSNQWDTYTSLYKPRFSSHNKELIVSDSVNNHYIVDIFANKSIWDSIVNEAVDQQDSPTFGISEYSLEKKKELELGNYVIKLLKPQLYGIYVEDREILRFKLENSIDSLTFSQNGEYLAVMSQDSINESTFVSVWDISKKTEILQLKRDYNIQTFIFSPESDRLLLITSEFIDILAFDRKRIVEHACYRLTRNLTIEEWQEYFPDEKYRKTCNNIP